MSETQQPVTRTISVKMLGSGEHNEVPYKCGDVMSVDFATFRYLESVGAAEFYEEGAGAAESDGKDSVAPAVPQPKSVSSTDDQESPRPAATAKRR